MTIPGSANPLLLAGAGGGYEIERSLRFNSADSAYLSRTPSVAGNRKTWTWAGWVKRSAIGTNQWLFAARGAASPYFLFGFNQGTDNSILRILGDTTTPTDLRTAQLFRDVSAWFHLVVAVDTTQATASNRIKVYVNGEQVTSFSQSDYPGQNNDTNANSTVIHHISGQNAFGEYFNGYLADIHFIDGQALDPTSFGEFDDNGVWQPKAYAGTYGTNGFHLPFNNNSTAAALGTDTSGNGNTWTVNNLSVAAGSGNDSLVDSPTNYGTDTGAGGEVRGNYATLNPVDYTINTKTFSNGNLDILTSATFTQVRGTLGASTGKWYWEITVNSTGNGAGIGICDLENTLAGFATATNYNWGGDNSKYINGSNQGGSGTTAYGAGDIVGVALNIDSNTVQFYRNGASAFTFSSLPAKTWFPWLHVNGFSFTCNFGQRPFAYTAPSGFKALCTTNLPTPTIADGSTAMDVALYTGNGSTQTISGLNFSPDLVWIKPRSAAYDHIAYDTVRGVLKPLFPNLTNAESPNFVDSLTAFNSDGYTLGNQAQINQSGVTFASWCWDAGSSTVTNTDGSITSQVRANPSAGFSVVTYTGTGSVSTIGHGLGVEPSFILIKSRSNAGTNWAVYHQSIGATHYMYLNTTAAAAAASVIWNNTAPSSSVFTVGTNTGVNQNTYTYVAYCFAPVAGYSAFGSYVGNGNADGPFVYTGFRPRYVLIRSTSGARDWMIKDALRAASYNPQDGNLYANQNFAEDVTASVYIDLLSNGFKLRGTYASINANAETFIYAAFSEVAFNFARGR